jgi:Tfp pilus assembly protein PilV
LVEAVVALVVLLAAMVVMTQLVGLAAQQRRLTEQRRVALQEVANQAERLSLAAWDEIAPGKLKGWQPSAELLAVAPEPTCRVSVSDEAGQPPARRICLSVSWTDSAGRELAPVELTIWRLRDVTKPVEEAMP